MSRIEFPEEVRKRAESIGSAELVIGIAGALHPEDVQARANNLAAELFQTLGTAPKTAVVYAGPLSAPDEPALPPPAPGSLEFLTYPLPAHDPSLGPWVEMSNTQRSVVALAASLQARACVVLHCDLLTLSTSALKLLAAPVLEGKCDLVTPIYPEGKYDSLINKSLLAPLSRALFGRRVRSPLPFDFCASQRMLARLADVGGQRNQPGQLLWPSNVVAMESGQIWQANIDALHTLHTEGLELSAVLAQLAGALFQEIETCAAHWQRSRPSQPVEICGSQTAVSSDGAPVDARPLIDSFILGSRNLDEVWRLVLPPVSLFELKRLTALPPDQFRMPDQLWARIIYDFALAYRLRRIGRTHLLGALTPLYLGWVASYAQEVAAANPSEADQRVEKLARAFEESKPYFVSRWRWPDRSS